MLARHRFNPSSPPSHGSLERLRLVQGITERGGQTERLCGQIGWCLNRFWPGHEASSVCTSASSCTRGAVLLYARSLELRIPHCAKYLVREERREARQ